jgi:peptidoglycan/LPS O-acetylase OafA/YrhL
MSTHPAAAVVKGSEPLRFVFIDGLRGVAAMMVVVVHISGAMFVQYGSWLPAWLERIMALGRLGVDVFFVLSGYVIAFSVRNGSYTFAFLGRFAVKRSVRLDPTYWVAIAAEVALVWLTAKLFVQFAQPLPSFATIAAHVLYLQDLLALGNINPVFWTLCIEVQFYVFFVMALVCLRRARESLQATTFDVVSQAFAVAVFIYSLCVFFGFAPNPHPGLFIERWWQFFVGVLAWRSTHAQRVKPEFLAALAAVACAWLAARFERGAIVIATTLTGSLIVAAALTSNMVRWLSSAPIQFLGRISYSLYLFHAVVGWRFARFVSVTFAPTAGPLLVAALFIVSIAACIVASWIVYRTVERPTLILGKAVRLDAPLSLVKLREAFRTTYR